LEQRHPGHAGQPRLAVDLHRARAALACLAVPADGEVARLSGLQPVQDVEDDLALVGLDLVVDQIARAGVATPDLHLDLGAHQCASSRAGSAASVAGGSSSSVRYFFSSARSNSSIKSARMGGIGCLVSTTRSPFSSLASEQTRLTLRHSGDMPG